MSDWSFIISNSFKLSHIVSIVLGLPAVISTFCNNHPTDSVRKAIFQYYRNKYNKGRRVEMFPLWGGKVTFLQLSPRLLSRVIPGLQSTQGPATLYGQLREAKHPSDIKSIAENYKMFHSCYTVTLDNVQLHQTCPQFCYKGSFTRKVIENYSALIFARDDLCKFLLH